MFTQRVYAVFISEVDDNVIEPFRKIGAVIDWGKLTDEPLVHYLEFNALAFEPDATNLLKELSKKEKIMLFWAYNDDLDMDIDSAGMHKEFAYSWGFNLLAEGKIQSSLKIEDNWPSYGDGLQAAISNACKHVNLQAFDGFLHIDTMVVNQLRDLFDEKTVFEQIEEGDLDQFILRDQFLETIKVAIL